MAVLKSPSMLEYNTLDPTAVLYSPSILETKT